MITKITEEQHVQLTKLIYQKFELADLIYKQIIMRIPDSTLAEPAPGSARELDSCEPVDKF